MSEDFESISSDEEGTEESVKEQVSQYLHQSSYNYSRNLSGITNSVCLLTDDKLNKIVLKKYNSMQDGYKEIDILAKLRDNISGLSESDISSPNVPNVLKTTEIIVDGSAELFVEFDFFEGRDLFQIITDEDIDLTEQQCSNIFRKITKIISLAHSIDIGHRDIKPENIIVSGSPEDWVNNDFKVRIIDWEFAEILANEKSNLTVNGTIQYLAPELVAYKVSSLANDIWALGVILHVMLSCEFPFDNNMEIMDQLRESKISVKYDLLPESTHGLFKQFLNPSRRKRIKIEQLLHHEWLML